MGMRRFLSFLLYPVDRPELFDAVVLEADDSGPLASGDGLTSSVLDRVERPEADYGTLGLTRVWPSFSTG